MTKKRYPRESPTARGYGREWRKFRLVYLAENPLCVLCAGLKPPRLTPATVIDHIKPMSQGGAKFDPDNLRAVCKACHDGPVQSYNRTGVMKGCDEAGNPLARDW